MVDAAPFRALRYDPAVAGGPLGTSAPAYDRLDPVAYHQHRTAGPYTVLQLLAADAGGGYAGAGDTYRRWIRTGVLVADDTQSFFVYGQQVPGGRGQQLGVLAAVRVEEPNGTRTILAHEGVEGRRTADRVARLAAVPADLAPVFALALRTPPALRALLQRAARGIPDIDLLDEGGVRHRIWRRPPTETFELRAQLAKVSVLIGDGHHRYAAAASAPGGRTLMLVVDAEHDGPAVLPVHRLLPRLPEDWRIRLRGSFDIRAATGLPRALASASEGTLGLLTPTAGFLLRPRDLAGLRADLPGVHTPLWRTLDTALVEGAVLPCLGIAASEVGYRADEEAMDDMGAGAAGVVLVRAPALATVQRLAATGEPMPPKTTSFSPKPRAGLLLRALDEADPPLPLATPHAP